MTDTPPEIKEDLLDKTSGAPTGAPSGWTRSFMKISSGGWALTCGLLLLITVGLAYSNTLHVPFLFDDIPNIKDRNHVKILDRFTLEKLWRFWISRFRRGRPVSVFTFGLNYCFGRFNPIGYHLVNIGIHIVAGFGVFLFTRTLLQESSALNRSQTSSSEEQKGRSDLIAIATALIWTLHPVQTESVTYIVQRMTSLAGLFYFWGLYFYLKRIVAETSGKRWIYFILVLICFAFGIGSKEIVATFPIAIYLMDLILLTDRNTFHGSQWIHLAGILGFTGVAGIFFLGGWGAFVEKMTLLVSGRELSYRHWSIIDRVMTEWRIVFRYLAIVFVPLPVMLNLDRNPDVSHGLLSPPTTLLALISILMLFFLAIRWRKSRPVVSFAIFWFALHLAITSTVLPLELMFDHRLYIALFGPVFLLTYTVGVRLNLSPGYLLGSGLVLILFLTGSTYARNMDWSSGVTLYRDIVEKAPENPRAHLNLSAQYLNKAKKLLKQDKFDRARQLLKNAYQHNVRATHLIRNTERSMKSNYHDGHFMINLMLAYIDLFKGNVNRAFERINNIPIPPRMKKYEDRAGIPLSRVAYANKNYRMSIRKNIRVLALSHSAIEPHNLLALSFLELGHSEVALKINRRALKKAPDHAETLRVKGEILRRMNRFDPARKSLERALAQNPEDRLVRGRIHESLAFYYNDLDSLAQERRHHARMALDLAADYVDQKQLQKWVPGWSPKTDNADH